MSRQTRGPVKSLVLIGSSLVVLAMCLAAMTGEETRAAPGYFTCKGLAADPCRACPKNPGPQATQCIPNMFPPMQWGNCESPPNTWCNEGRLDCGDLYDCQDPPTRLGFCPETMTWTFCEQI